MCNTFFEPEVGMPLKKILKGEDDQPKAPDLILALWPHALGKTQPKVGDFKTLTLREAPQKKSMFKWAYTWANSLWKL